MTSSSSRRSASSSSAGNPAVGENPGSAAGHRPVTGKSGLSPIERTMRRRNYERNTSSTRWEHFKLDTVRLMLERLGNPHLQLNIVHVAGTKGKGSTSHFVAQFGKALALKTGVYSSPHFENYTERFRIDGEEVLESQLNPCLERALAVAETLDQEIREASLEIQPATFFDISTVCAFLLFAEQNVELVALEVGLGGRLDSTNVCQAKVAVITNISLDHTRQLGSNTRAIAGEKAGIIKSRAPAICGPVDSEVLEVIQNKAREHDAPFYQFGKDFGYRDETIDSQGSCYRFNYWNQRDDCSIDDIELRVLGEHQMANACLALTALLQAVPGLTLNRGGEWKKACRKAAREIRLPGRLEVVSNHPMIIADMAHNEASIEAMIRGLKSLRRLGKKQAIFSCSKDKDHLAMLHQLVSYFDRIILTEFQDNPRSCPLQSLQQSAESLPGHLIPNVEKLSTTWELIPKPVDAWNAAMRDIESCCQTVICGSVFLIGELLPVIRECQRTTRL